MSPASVTIEFSPIEAMTNTVELASVGSPSRESVDATLDLGDLCGEKTAKFLTI